MTQYPGDDPDDPFAKPPRTEGGAHAGDETAPISGAGQATPPPPPPPAAPAAPAEQPGYWEQQAQQNPPSQEPQGSNPWAGYGQPADPSSPTPPPPPAGDLGAYPQPYATPAYGAPGYAAPPNHPNSTTALVLGIVSIACCGFAGPFAWYIGGKARREIRESNGQLGGDGAATAGWIMGIIATVLIVIGIIAVIAIVAIAASTSTTTSYDY